MAKSQKNKDAEFILRKGRMNLLMDHPFWGEMALRLRLIPAAWVPTTAIDARGNLYYNQKWVSENFCETGQPMGTVDAMAEFAHEIGHLMFRHHVRRPAAALPLLWNLAGDQIIDTHLVKDGIEPSLVMKKMVPEEVMKECLLPDGRIKPIEMRYKELEKKMQECPSCKVNFEKYKEMIKKQQQGDQVQAGQQDGQGQQPGSGQPGQGEADGEGHDHGDGSSCGHDHGEGSGSGEPEEKHEGGGYHLCDNPRLCCGSSMDDADPQVVEEWKQYFMAAAKTAKSKGKIPGVAQDFLAELEKPSRDWRDIVRAQASQIYRGRYTQKRPSRRSHAIGTRLPARNPKPQPAVVAMDCSGSVSALAARFASEIAGILTASGAPEVLIMFHDVVVYHMEVFEKNDLNKLKVSHGGTSHQDVFRKLEEISPRPGMLVCFTDLYSDQMVLEDPGIPVIWAHPEGIGEDADIPFGRKVEVSNDLGGDDS